MNTSKLWTKDFIILLVTTFFIYLAYFLLMTTLTVYAIEEFNVSESNAGLASGIFIIGALVVRIFAGNSIERIGRRKMLLSGLFLFLLTTLLYFAVENFNLLLLVRFLHGAAFGVATTATATVAMDIIPPERRGEGTSYYAMSSTLATAIGPFLGLFISQHASFTVIFLVCTLLSVINMMISLVPRIPEVTLTKEQLNAINGFKFKNFFEEKAIPISLMTALIGVAYSGILAFINSYGQEIDLMDAASFFFIVYAVFILVSRPFAGQLFDKKGENLVVYPSIILFALGLVILSQAHQGFSLLLAGALIGLGYGNVTSSAQAIAVKEAPKHRVALATTTYYIFIDTGIGIGPYILGALIPLIGFRGLYLILAVIVFTCILLYYLLHGKKSSFKKQHSYAG